MNQSKSHVIEPVELEMPVKLLSSCDTTSIRADNNELIFVLYSADKVRQASKSSCIILHAHTRTAVPLGELVVHVDSQDAVDTQKLKNLGHIR